MAKRSPDFVFMACTTASVSYRESLTPEELVGTLLTGHVPQHRKAHLITLLEEAPVQILEGLVEQVGGMATRAQVARNIESIAKALGSNRDVRTWLK